MLREVSDDQTIVNWEDYRRLIKKAFMFDRLKEWAAQLEYEPGYEKFMEKEETK